MTTYKDNNEGNTGNAPQKGTKKRGSIFALFSWTKLNVTLWAAAVIVVAAVVLRLCTAVKDDRTEVGVDNRIDVTPTLITSMKEIGEWEFLAIDDEELVDTVRKGFLKDDKLVRIYYGRLSLGINMHKADPQWVTTAGDTVTVTLPRMELLDNDFIDETRTKAFIETGDWTDADREALYRKAYGMMKRRCVTAANIKTAERNAADQLGRMLKALGVEKYKIVWK